MLPLTKILCPTDFSEPSYEAVKIAKEWASYYSAELCLLHVVSPAPFIPIAPEFVTPELVVPEQELESSAKKSLAGIVDTFGLTDLKVRLLVLLGNPAEEIVRTGEEEQVDLIVIATHGRTGLGRLIFGSVAEKVVRLAGCPVLTVSGQLPKPSEEKVNSEKGE